MIFDYFRDKATLLRRIARLEVKIEHKNRQIGGHKSAYKKMVSRMRVNCDECVHKLKETV